jgi:hypothetical protein
MMDTLLDRNVLESRCYYHHYHLLERVMLVSMMVVMKMLSWSDHRSIYFHWFS